MALQLGGVDTARRQEVLWDPDSHSQCVEAQQRIDELCDQGFLITEEDNGEVTLEPPERDPNICVFRILSQNGDDRVIWDRRDKSQVKEAFQKFKELLKKGYTAYVTRIDGSKGHKITEFHPGLEEILLQAKEAVCVPKTVPG